jgi:bifunctional ADP-heptose synthase (sugar kinase/adenylyltransferase)
MDTRRKILTLDAALRLPRSEFTVAAGYFDALRAAHIRDLATLPRPVLAVVLPLAGELLPQRARAEMTAALRVIDYVVIADNKDLDALVEALAPRELVRLETRDAALVQQLIEHVHRRQTR